MEDEIHTGHGVQHALRTAHVADVKLELAVVVVQPQFMLLLLITAEDADLGDVSVEKAIEDGVAEGAGDEKSSIA